MTWLVPVIACVFCSLTGGFVGYRIGRIARSGDDRYNAACTKEYERLCQAWSDKTDEQAFGIERRKPLQ